MKQATMITTDNPEWGFYGTTRSNEGATEAQAAADFDAAARAIVERFDTTAELARIVLDAPFGRHLADKRLQGESPSQLVAGLSCGWRGALSHELARARRAVRAGSVS